MTFRPGYIEKVHAHQATAKCIGIANDDVEAACGAGNSFDVHVCGDEQVTPRAHVP